MTNLYGVKKYGKGWINLTLVDFRAFIGLLILAGVSKSNQEDANELWDDEWGRPIFAATMTLKKFKLILQCLRFDDRSSRQERRERDKLAPIRSVYDKWNINLRKMYNPGKAVTVDEQLIPFRGKCPIKQFIPSKPKRYGPKMWACCDSKSAYVWNTQIYCGKAPNTKPEKNQGQRVLLEMTEGLHGRLVCADNLFSTYEGVKELQRRKLNYLGTVRKNKTFVPPSLLDMKKKPVGHSQFLFDNKNQLSMVSYVPKKNRCVLLISSAHMNYNVSMAENKKPQMILDYNEYKCGVDLADQMISTYTCARRHKRWPCAIFDYIINTSALNGYIIHSEINPNWCTNPSTARKKYLKELGLMLVKTCQLQRATLPRNPNSARFLKRTQQAAVPLKASSSAPSTSNQEGRLKKRQRCEFCPYQVNANKHSTSCQICKKPICPQHTAPTMCKKCQSSKK